MMEAKIDWKKIPLPDRIQFHRQIGAGLYDDLVEAALRISNLEVNVNKMGAQLKHERSENKALQQQIKMLQFDLIENDGGGKASHKMLKDKDNLIQTLQKKMEIPSTQLIQYPEETKLIQEKEYLSREISNNKAELLRFAGKEGCREKERMSLKSRVEELLGVI